MNLDNCLNIALKAGDLATVKHIWDFDQSLFQPSVMYAAIAGRDPLVFDFMLSKINFTSNQYLNFFRNACVYNNSYAAKYYAERLTFHSETVFVDIIWQLNNNPDIEPYFYNSIPVYRKQRRISVYISAAIVKGQYEFLKHLLNIHKGGQLSLSDVRVMTEADFQEIPSARLNCIILFIDWLIDKRYVSYKDIDYFNDILLVLPIRLLNNIDVRFLEKYTTVAKSISEGRIKICLYNAVHNLNFTLIAMTLRMNFTIPDKEKAFAEKLLCSHLKKMIIPTAACLPIPTPAILEIVNCFSPTVYLASYHIKWNIITAVKKALHGFQAPTNDIILP